MILITGATGSNDSEIIKLLTKRNISVRAMVRGDKRPDWLRSANFETVQGDFDQPETLRTVLPGVERAFLVTNSTENAEAQQLAFVEAAKESGVRHVVKLSQLSKNSEIDCIFSSNLPLKTSQI